MRSKVLSNLETADLCRELALLLHSGVSIGDGLYLLTEEEKDPALHAMLDSMAKTVDWRWHRRRRSNQLRFAPPILHAQSDVTRTRG